jgi:hypothetical protein
MKNFKSSNGNFTLALIFDANRTSGSTWHSSRTNISAHSVDQSTDTNGLSIKNQNK